MKGKSGVVFSLTTENAAVPGCTVSNALWESRAGSLICFSLGADTDISAETSPFPQLLYVDTGCMTVFTTAGEEWHVKTGQALLVPADVPTGMKAAEDTVYLEIVQKEDTHMNKVIKAGNVFKLADLVPYQDGRIVNMDVVNNDHLKLAIMSFADGTGLSEHAAPGEALVLALEGKGIIGYEGQDHPIQAGETFKFDKLGRHSVKADGPFKMALFLTLDA
jgi:quercetin dioxygenase-like cupin family protein